MRLSMGKDLTKEGDVNEERAGFRASIIQIDKKIGFAKQQERTYYKKAGNKSQYNVNIFTILNLLSNMSYAPKKYLGKNKYLPKGILELPT